MPDEPAMDCAAGLDAESTAISRRAIALHQAGRLAEAVALYRKVLAAAPAHAESLHLLGVLELQRGNCTAAIALIDSALAVEPDNAFAHSNRAVALGELGRHAEAVASCDRALSLRPDYAEAHNNRGTALNALARHGEALEGFDRALAIKPDYVSALANRTASLIALRRFEEARSSADKAIAIDSHNAEAFNNRGNAFKAMGAFASALADYDQAIALRPGFARAFVNRGLALTSLRRLEEALASFDRAIALAPYLAEAFTGRGAALDDCGKYDEALASYDRAIVLKPDDADALCNRGNTLLLLDRIAEAAVSYRGAAAVDPNHPVAAGGIADCASRLCDWTRRDAIIGELRQRSNDGTSRIQPLVIMRYIDDPALQLACARQYASMRLAGTPTARWHRGRRGDNRSSKPDAPIRLACLSADFRQHPVAQLMADLFERLDRARFEVIGISLGPDDGSALRQRIVRGCDGFYDVAAMSNRDVARLIREQHTDIAVDLAGYTTGCRPEILGFRPAPLAVSYLGFPGTMGADFIDYIIADPIVLPASLEPYFAEKVVRLPNCYLANPPYRPVTAPVPTRRDAGLPETGFVFCCFNNHAKLAPPVFDIWMRLAAAVDGVLWLSPADEATAANLRRQAAACGGNPARLVFASRMESFDDHLARHRLAGLFLDTLPYNAHTTASDALRAGLPVLTCRGNAFAGRVAASLLHAVRLPECVTTSLAEYEALALRLATDPLLLAEITAKLARNLPTSPLFAADRFCRDIEATFAAIWERHQRCEPPPSFTVEPDLPAGAAGEAFC